MLEHLNLSLDELVKRLELFYQTPGQIQSFLNQLKREIYQQQSKIEKNEKKLNRMLQRFEERKRRVEMLDKMIRIIRENSQPVPEGYKNNKLYNEEDLRYEKLWLEEWLSKHDGDSLNDGFLKCHASRMLVNYLQEAALRTCRWFESGAVGPGTVTFGLKEYKAE